MKLIIDIPEDVYTIIKNEPYMSRVMNFGSTLTDAIYDGTPLPKGHGRLIDENDLWFEDIDNISCVTQRDVEHAPTIIEADEGEQE